MKRRRSADDFAAEMREKRAKMTLLAQTYRNHGYQVETAPNGGIRVRRHPADTWINISRDRHAEIDREDFPGWPVA